MADVPIFELYYTDGIIKGQGYIGGLRPDATISVGAPFRARQKFVPSFATTINAMWLWTSRGHTAALDLTIALRNASQTLLSSQVLLSSAVSQSNMALADDAAVSWVRVPMSVPTQLVAGDTYYLVLSAAAGATWRFQAGANGTSLLLFGEDKAATWGGPALATEENARRAEYSNDSGSSWLVWPADLYSDGLDLPILFELQEPEEGGPEEPPTPPTPPLPPLAGGYKGSKAGHGRGGTFSFMQVRMGGGTGMVANPDAATVQSGGVTNIPVLGNDVPATGTIIDGIEVQASQGTAAVSGSNVQYQSTAPFVGTDTFRYRARRTADNSTSTALVTVTVTASTGGPVAEYPTPLRTFTVTSRAELVTRYGAAIAGDLIKVAAGVNLGGFTFGRHGDNAGRPIVVAIDAPAPHAGSAYFSSPVTVTGRYNMLWGLRGMGQTFVITGQGSIMRRVLWTGARIRTPTSQPIQVQVEGSDIGIEYCEMTDCDSRGISMHGSSRRCHVTHTYFHNFTVTAADEVYECLEIGRGGGDYLEGSSLADGNEIGWCYFDNVNLDNGESETPSIKHPFCHVHDCHIHNAKNVTLRISRDSLLERIRCTGSSYLVAGGPDHMLNSVWIQANNGFQLIAGKVDCTSSTAGGDLQRNFVRGQLHGCKGRISVGAFWGTLNIHRAHTIYLLGHLGNWDGSATTITNVQGGANEITTFVASPNPVEAPPSYTSTSQGLLADL